MDEGKVVKVVVATHKAYRMPKDEMYLPMQVGTGVAKDKAGNPVMLDYAKDNTGDNIAAKNPNYCELTALYWAWKNLDADYIGLVHYRRHFGYRHTRDPFDSILTYRELSPMLDECRVIVPTKRRYFIESLYSHYKHTHYVSQLGETRAIIGEMYPEYLESYDRVINQTYGYMFNMTIMEKPLLDEYCTWLFHILFELEARIGRNDLVMPELSPFQGRFYGRVSEIIFNVWLDYQLILGESGGGLKPEDIKEVPWLFTEKVDQIKKGTAFIKAKFLGKRYEGSF